MDRSYEERQRFPGDAEAVEGMGVIADQKMEHLVPSDKAIMLYRKRLRKLCGELEQGNSPRQVNAHWPNPVPTYGGDTVLNIPNNGQDDTELLRGIGERVMQIQFDAELLEGGQRDDTVIEGLISLETEYLS